MILKFPSVELKKSYFTRCSLEFKCEMSRRYSDDNSFDQFAQY